MAARLRRFGVVSEQARKTARLERLAAQLVLVILQVSTPPGKSWIFFLKIPGARKSWKSTLVLESPGKISLKITHFLFVLMENKQK